MHDQMGQNQPENRHNRQAGTPQTEFTQTVVPSSAEELYPTDEFSQLSKQCHDLAFAVAGLRTGAVTLRSLALATRSWTTFGSIPLSDHLVSAGTLTVAQKSDAHHMAEQMLASITVDDAVSGQESPSHSLSSRDRHWVTRLDRGGKVAKLLGIADTSALSGAEMEGRSVAARYTLLRKLGQGGLGVVWLARDRNLQRYVAVKELARDAGGSNGSLDYFRREAEITGRLEHPGIVPVYQYGEDEDSGRSFYVMRFLGKKTLQDAIEEYHERREAGNDDPMMLHRLLSALVNVCLAVAHAHSRKVVHRDLKPENVALDEFGQVTLLDWGLAKVNDATGMYDANGNPEPGDLHSVGSTQVGRVLGTPLFMAPEQAAGRLDEVDELTDIFALGGILYAILTGVGPNHCAIERSTTGDSGGDIMSQIVGGAIHPPRELNSAVPPELDAVCMKALSAKRYLRYEEASELEKELQRFIAGSPVEAYTPPFKQRIRQWMVAHPTLTQTFLLLISLIILTGAAIGWTVRQAGSALQQERYASMQELVRELEVNLNFETRGMMRNLQFMSGLPLMEAIVLSQQQQQQDTRSAPDGPPEVSSGQPDVSDRIEDAMAVSPTFNHLGAGQLEAMSQIAPEEWLNRQGNVYDGLLRANPAYLVAATGRWREDGTITELVRSERLVAGRTVYRVPQKQLTVDLEAGSTDEAEVLQTLRPEEVVLCTNDQLSESIPTNSRSPLVLSGVQAIFSPQGDLFGLNIIEMDLRTRLEELFAVVDQRDLTVYVTDRDGHVVLLYADGRFAPTPSGMITSEFPQLQDFFAEGSLTPEFSDGSTLYAKRVRLGDSPKALIGIVASTRPIRSPRDFYQPASR